MAEYGARITNDDHQVQIDSQYTNHVFYSQSSLPSGDHVVAVSTASAPLLAIKNGCCRVTGMNRSGDLYTGINIKIWSPSTATVLAYVAEYGKSTSGHGLRTYRQDGKLAFDSDNRFLRIAGAYDMSDRGKVFEITQDGKWRSIDIDRAVSIQAVSDDEYVIVSRIMASAIISRFEGGSQERQDRFYSVGLVNRMFELRTLDEGLSGYGTYDINQIVINGMLNTCTL